MRQQLTPWFSWPVVPVREGWYDWRGFAFESGERLYWNGHEFGHWLGSTWIAMADDESDQWRGLASSVSRLNAPGDGAEDELLSLLQRARLYTNAKPAASEAAPFAAFRADLNVAIKKAERR